MHVVTLVTAAKNQGGWRMLSRLVVCAAAVVSAFMATPPRPVLDNFVNPADDLTVKQFLDKRFHFGVGADSSHVFDHDLRNDRARLQNIPYEYQGVHRLTVVDVRKRILGPRSGVPGALRYTWLSRRRV